MPRRPVQDLPLAYFIVRSQSLIFYRQILRSLNQLSDYQTASELKQQIRYEFESARGITDPTQCKTLLSQGRQRFKILESNLSLSGAK
jgi:hypothetical protein